LAALPFATVLVATLGSNLAALLQQLGDRHWVVETIRANLAAHRDDSKTRHLDRPA